MRSGTHRAGLCLASLLAILAGTFPPIGGMAAATGDELALPRAQVSWPRDSIAVSTWAVRPEDGETTDSAWRSLISETAEGRLISRHLAVETSRVGDWIPMDASEPGEAPPQSARIRRSFISADGTLMMRQELEPLEGPFRFRFSLELTNRDSRPRPSGDAARVMLGPGIGEAPMRGLGIATGLYSYVEPVVFQAGEMRRFQVEGDSGPGTVELASFQHDDWTGLNSRYFALLIAPRSGTLPDLLELGRGESPDPETLPSRYLPSVSLNLPVPALAPGESTRWTFQLFSGPKSRAALDGGNTVGFGDLLFPGLWTWMRGLSLGLLWVLQVLYSAIPNWALAICLLAVLVRLALYPFARWALASQQRFAEVQRIIQPEIRDIKQRYRGGEQSERILNLYEKHGVSPVAGLKPLLIVLIQLPIFIALFHVLGQAFEFREASFLWIDSLGEPDRLFGFGMELPFFGAYFNLLPVLMALTTLATIMLSPAPAATRRDRRRQNVFLGLMAAGFFLLFYPFPSGMVLYWTMANVLHILQARMFQGGGDAPADSAS